MSKYDYVDRTPYEGWLMEVRKGPSQGSRNAIRPMLEDVDMEALKAKIEELDL
jgi:hypothetical protein